mmetsp:Transcript_95788/g.310357  ORF Transcript_95788/g.310357 Transcript_95788/m.310357 type:complete len:88 (+) Transcript_95788:223-486(+)
MGVAKGPHLCLQSACPSLSVAALCALSSPPLITRVTAGKRLLEEDEWRKLGVTQSRGWGHYEIHRPEPHILLFRRALGTDPNTGKPK